MRRLVMTHQKERSVWIAFFQPPNRFVGDDVCHIASFIDRLSHLDHRWIEIFTLSVKNRPEVKSGWLVILAFTKVPFAYDGCLVSTGLKMLGNIRQTVVEMCLKRCYTVHMVVSAGENGGPACCPWP